MAAPNLELLPTPVPALKPEVLAGDAFAPEGRMRVVFFENAVLPNHVDSTRDLSTIGELCDELGAIREHAVVWVNDEVYEPGEGMDVEPMSGSIVVVQGFHGNPIIIAQLALVIGGGLTIAGHITGNRWLLLAGGLVLLGAGAIPSANFTAGLNSAVNAGAAFGAATAFNAIVSPQTTPDAALGDGPPAILSTGNSVALYEPIPRVFGERRIYPNYGAYPYTEVIGTQTYFHGHFVVSYGPCEVSELRIGDTSIDAFGPDVIVEIIEGDEPDQALKGFPNQPFHKTYDGLVIMDYDKHDPSVKRTTSVQTSRCNITLYAPTGFWSAYDGNRQNLGTSIFIMVQRTDGGGTGDRIEVNPHTIGMSGAWHEIHYYNEFYSGRFKDNNVILLWGDKNAPFYFNMAIDLEAIDGVGTYDVWVEAIGDHWRPYEDEISQDLLWASMTSFSQGDPFPELGFTKVYLRIKASDQLRGNIDSFNCMVKAKIPVWNGSQWTAPQATRSPAWAYAEMMRGNVASYPVNDAFIDGQRLLEWDNAAVANGWTFDAVISSKGQLWDTLVNIAGAAQASPTVRDGKYSVVIDDDKSALPRAQLFTPRNVKSMSFTGQKIFKELPHAIRVRFENAEENYVDDELIVYRDGFNVGNSTRFETLKTFGITNADRAYQYARFHLLQEEYRPETYTIETDIEYIVAERGDWVRLGHDVPEFGSQFMRIRSIMYSSGDATEIAVDEAVHYDEFESDEVTPARYAVTIRKSDNSSLVGIEVSNLAAGIGEADAYRIVPVVPIDSSIVPEIKDLVAFGVLGIEVRDCQVLSIQPRPDMSATLQLRDAAQAIFTDMGDPIPPYDPGIPPSKRIPPIDIRVVGVVANASSVTLSVRLYQDTSRIEQAATAYQGEWRNSNSPTWIRISEIAVSSNDTDIVFAPAADDAIYDFRVRSVGGIIERVEGAWFEVLGHHFIDPSARATDFEISGMRLVGGYGADLNSFASKDATIEFRVNSPSLYRDGLISNAIIDEDEFSKVGLGGINIRVIDSDLRQIRSSLIQELRYTYDFVKNVDDGGPRRSFIIEASPMVRGVYGAPVQIAVENPAPPVPGLVSLVSGHGEVFINLMISGVDPDVVGVIIWASETQGFEPGHTYEEYRGLDGASQFSADEGYTYIRFAAYDRFSSAISELNISGEHTLLVESSIGDGEVLPQHVKHWLVSFSGPETPPNNQPPGTDQAPYFYNTVEDQMYKWNGFGWVVHNTVDSQNMLDETIFNRHVVELNAVKLNAGTIAADRIGARTIATEKLIVSGGNNLAPDPTFDLIVADADIPLENVYTVAIFSSGSAVVSFVAFDPDLAAAYAGQAALKVTDPGPVELAVYCGADHKKFVSCAQGDVFSFSAKVRNGIGFTRSVFGRIVWYAANGDQLLVSNGTDGHQPTDSAWSDVTVDRAVAPATAAYVTAGIVVQGTGTGSLFADAYMFRRAVGSAYIEKASIGTLEVDELHGDVITARTLTGESLDFKTIKTQNLVLQHGNNLIQDPGFEQQSLAEWGNAAGGGGTWTIIDDSAESLGGKRYVEFDTSGMTVSADLFANGDILQDSAHPAVGGGKYTEPTSLIVNEMYYYFEYWHKLKTGSADPGDVNQHRALIRFIFDWADYQTFIPSSYVDLGDAFTARSTSDWQEEFHLGILPPGAVGVQFWIQVHTDAEPSGAVFNFDDLHARITSHTNEIDPEASTSVRTLTASDRMSFAPHYEGSIYLCHFEGEYDPNILGAQLKTSQYLQFWLEGVLTHQWLYPLNVGKVRFNHTFEISNSLWDGSQNVEWLLAGTDTGGADGRGNQFVQYDFANVVEYKR